MAESGGQLGNDNAKRGMECRQALKRALIRKSDGDNYRDGLDKVMDQFVLAALAGEAWAIKEIIDRLDGKAIQAIELSGREGGPIPAIQWTISPVTPLSETNESGD